ncbi:MAG: LamG-like jellyroll fold domain-containing protein [Minisyncoccales bacterium]|jgi:prepilin-type N-terminal cleavage/methylation domain-containing protein
MKNKSFTLIELLVVIVIIGILAGVIMISTSSSIDKANFAKAQAFSSTVQNELLLNLVSEWTFDEGPTLSGLATNADVKDVWGNNNGDVTSHAPSVLTGDNCLFNKCLQFTGTNYIFVPDNESTRLSSVTITAWIKASASYNSKFLSKRNDSTFYFLGLTSGGKRPYLGIGSSSYNLIEWGSDLTLNEWHFIAGTFDEVNSKGILFVDGISKSQSMSYNVGDLTDRPVIIGAESTSGTSISNFFRGNIDNVKLYNAYYAAAYIKKDYILGLNNLFLKGFISKEEYNERINTLAYDK